MFEGALDACVTLFSHPVAIIGPLAEVKYVSSEDPQDGSWERRTSQHTCNGVVCYIQLQRSLSQGEKGLLENRQRFGESRRCLVRPRQIGHLSVGGTRWVTARIPPRGMTLGLLLEHRTQSLR
jgi:hypothetical protein